MLILIPPSEGKSSNNTTEKKFHETNFIFSEQVKEIIEILKTKNEEIFDLKCKLDDDKTK